jgi:hypothetical protein
MSLNKVQKEWLMDCALGRENVARFMFEKILENINDEENQN